MTIVDRRTFLLIPLAVAALLPTLASAHGVTGPQTVTGTKPAIVIKTNNLGKVLATPSRFGIYYWSVEKQAGGRIRCTGQCAVAWPPVYVTGTVQKHVKGVTCDLRDDQARREAPAHDQRATRLHLPPRSCGRRPVRQRRRVVRRSPVLGALPRRQPATVARDAESAGLPAIVW